MTTTSSTSTSTSTSTAIGRPAARGIAILPLRLFLGVTFVDAGLGKLLSAAYLGHGPQGFAAQARGFANGSPIGALVRAVAVAHPTPTGLLLAIAELAIGLLTLAGLASRAAAAGRLARRQRALAGLGDDREVALPLDRVQQVCAVADPSGRCAGAAGRTCRGQQCPLFPQEPGPVAFDAGRRALLARGALAGVVLVGTGVLGAAIAAAERLLGSDGATGGIASLPSQPTRPPARRTSPSSRAPAGTRIGSLSDIAVGQAAAFTTRTGQPAVAVRLGQRRVVAYSAVCTHAGCTVGYDSSGRLLACPCHCAQFDPARGAAAVAGPTSVPLPSITLHVGTDGGLYLPPSR